MIRLSQLAPCISFSSFVVFAVSTLDYLISDGGTTSVALMIGSAFGTVLPLSCMTCSEPPREERRQLILQVSAPPPNAYAQHSLSPSVLIEMHQVPSDTSPQLNGACCRSLRT